MSSAQQGNDPYDARRVAEMTAQRLAEEVLPILTAFFVKDQLEMIRDLRAAFDENDSIGPILDWLLVEVERYYPGPPGMTHFEVRFWSQTQELVVTNLRNFVHLCSLVALLDSRHGPVPPDMQRQLRRDSGLTPAAFQQACLKPLRNIFATQTTHGGSDPDWNKARLLGLLGLYNRFRIVIKNARRLRKNRLSKKSLGPRARKKIENEVLAEYNIAENFVVEDFWMGTARDVAVSCVITCLEIPNLSPDNVDKLRSSAQKEWNRISCDIPGLLLIDTFFSDRTARYYAVDIDDSDKCAGLRFSPVNKFLSIIDDMEEGYLVLQGDVN